MAFQKNHKQVDINRWGINTWIPKNQDINWWGINMWIPKQLGY